MVTVYLLSSEPIFRAYAAQMDRKKPFQVDPAALVREASYS